MSPMPTTAAPPRRPLRARRETRCRRDRHRTRCTRSSHPHHAALARYYDPAIGRFTAVDPIIDGGQPGSLDRFGYGLNSPVTLSDPTGLRVPVGSGSDPDSGGSYDARRQLAVSGSGGSPTRLRLPGQTYTPVRSPTSKGTFIRYTGFDSAPTRSEWDLAYEFVQNPRHLADGHVDLTGPFDCTVGVEGCAWQSRYVTVEVLLAAYARWAGIEATFHDVGPLPDFFADLSGVVADVSGGLSVLALTNPLTAPASPLLSGVSTTASGTQFVLGLATGDQNHITRGGVGLITAGTVRGIGVIADGLGATATQQRFVDLVAGFYSEYGQTLI